MKKSKLFLAAALLATLVGCGTNNNSHTFSKPHSSWPEENFSHLTTDVITECTFSGSIVEINTGCYLAPNDSYYCMVKPNDYTNTAIRIVSSNEEVITTEMVEGTLNSFNIITHGVGDTILKIYAEEDDFLIYRNVIRVRPYYDEKQIQEVVFDKYDIWNSTGIFGNYQMSFFSIDPLSGLCSGRDDMESTVLSFNLKFVETKKIYDFTFHSFEVEVDMENSQTRRTYTELDIAVTGDNILFYYEEGLLEMFRPDVLMKPSFR